MALPATQARIRRLLNDKGYSTRWVDSAFSDFGVKVYGQSVDEWLDDLHEREAGIIANDLASL